MPEQLHFKLLQRMKTMICNQFRSNGKGLCNRCDLKSKDHRLTGAHSPRSGRWPGSGGGGAAAVPMAKGGAVQPRGSPASAAQQSDGPQRLAPSSQRCLLVQNEAQQNSVVLPVTAGREGDEEEKITKCQRKSDCQCWLSQL